MVINKKGCKNNPRFLRDHASHGVRRNKMKFLTVLLIGLILSGSMSLICADHGTKDLLILTRLFQGEQQASLNGVIPAGSQFIDPYSQTFKDYLKQSKQEALRIKEVYNLAAVYPLAMAKWQWEEKKPGKLANTLSLKQATFSIQMEQLGGNRFKVTVIEGKDFMVNHKELLSSEFVLPPSHTTIFGYKDGRGKVFFLSFHHQGTAPSMSKENFKPSNEKIITKTVPIYPKGAMENNIEGTVVLKGHFNENGGVIPETIQVVIGHPQFNAATIKSLSGLRYNPQFTPIPLNKVLFVTMYRIFGENDFDGKAEYKKLKATSEYQEQIKLQELDKKKGLHWLLLGAALVKPQKK
jgi:Gram-negative bacterial TonB protein C-terminal